MINVAARSTGLADFGATMWEPAYRTLVRALNEEAELHTLGRLLCRHDLLRHLRNRLQLAPLFRGVAAERIEQPIFVVGPPRSGTSILFELLSQDERFRTPATWEVHRPAPPPQADSYRRDPRIALGHREATFWNDVRPEYRAMHEEGGQLPKECIAIMSHEFNSDYWTQVASVPSYNAARGGWDAVAPYRYHRQFLQVLQSRHRRDHWLLKAPSHLLQLRSLFAVYPDARVVHTHRDPHRTVPSTISILRATRRMRTDAALTKDEARRVGLGLGYVLQMVTSWRKDGEVPEAQFADVHFTDLMTDAVGTIGKLYQQLGWKLTDEMATRIERYLKNKPRGKFGRHEYSLADEDISPADVDAAYATYVDYYRVAGER
jgi:Sulfotransferase domain.